MHHGKRRRLTCKDMDCALRVKNIEPLYGFECSEYIPLRHTSGGGKDLYYPDEQELDLVEVISTSLPKLPYDVTLRTHWLAVEGVQPTVPENVPPLSLEQQREQAAAVSLPDEGNVILSSKEVRLERKKKDKTENMANGEWSKLKSLQSHGLSLEQQLYFKEVTDASVGLSDTKRQEALTSLSTDPGLYQLLPHLISFVSEGVKLNISQRKMSMTRNLLRMAKALLENPSVSLEMFLHELIPLVISCMLNKQLCMRPESEDHWSLRELAAKIMAAICTKYSNTVNNIQSRVTRILLRALSSNLQGLAVHYGAVIGFVELGQEAVAAAILPRLKQEGEFIKAVQMSSGTAKVMEQIAANRLRSLLLRSCSPSLLLVRSPSDTLQMYQSEYGYLGPELFNQVKVFRQGRPTVTLANGVKLTTTQIKSPTAKIRPPPLSLPSQVTATKISTPRGITPISLASPTAIAAALRAVTQTVSSPQGTISSPIGAIPVSILSAVVNNPSVVQVLASQFTNSESLGIASITPSSPAHTLPQATPTSAQPTTPTSRHSS